MGGCGPLSIPADTHFPKAEKIYHAGLFGQDRGLELPAPSTKARQQSVAERKQNPFYGMSEDPRRPDAEAARNPALLLFEPVFGLELLLVEIPVRVKDVVPSFETPNCLILASSACVSSYPGEGALLRAVRTDDGLGCPAKMIKYLIAVLEHVTNPSLGHCGRCSRKSS